MILNYKLIVFIVIIGSFLAFSCSNSKIDKVVTYEIIKKDYIDYISAEGITEARKAVSIICPETWGNTTITYLIPEGKIVKKGDTLCIIESENMQNEYIELVDRLGQKKAQYNSSVAELNFEKTNLKAQMKVVDAATSITMLDSNRLNFSTKVDQQITKLKLEQAQIKKDNYINKLSFLEEINQLEINKLDINIRMLEDEIKDVKEKLNDLTIVSKSKGMVVYGLNRRSRGKYKEGDGVRRGSVIMKLPDMSKMQVRLEFNETKFKRIEKKQKVEISIVAFPEIKAFGQVKKIKPRGKSITKGSKVKFYEAVVSVDSSNMKIVSGLTAICNIIINQISDTIVIPSLSIFEDDSVKYVYLLQKNNFTKRKVEIELSDLKNTVISNGLANKDIIALNKPGRSIIK